MTPELERAAAAAYETRPLSSGTDMPRKPEGANYAWDELAERDHHLAHQHRTFAAAVLRSVLMEPSEEVVEETARAICRTWLKPAPKDEPGYTEQRWSLFRDEARAALRAAAMKMLGEG